VHRTVGEVSYLSGSAGLPNRDAKAQDVAGRCRLRTIGMYAADYARLPSMAPARSATNPNTPEIEATIR
jgi:hypothetical protein